MLIRSLARRTAVVATGGALVASGLLVAAPVPQAHAATESTTSDAAATWLTGRLNDQHLLSYQNLGTVSVDVGLSVDLLLGLVATGDDTTADQIASAVAVKTGEPSGYGRPYSYPGTFNCATLADEPEAHTYAGDSSNAIAKALAGLTAAGLDGTNPAVADLTTRLDLVTIDGGADAGRITDSPTRDGAPLLAPTCDYANVFGQAFAVRALDAVGSDEEDAALGYLLSQQNADGSWNEGLRPVGDVQPAANPSTDGTATALVQLQQIAPSAGLAADTQAAIDKGVAWLELTQAADGSFGGTGQFGPNANETGLAGWALGLAGQDDAAASAAGWLAAHQVVKLAGCTTTLDAQSGAVAYTDASLAEARTDGITPAVAGEWIRASAQALPALAYLPTGAPVLTGPTGYVKAGAAVSVKVAGLPKGAQSCVAGVGPARRLTGSGVVSLSLPAGTRNHTVTLRTLDGTTTTTVKALGATKLKVKVPAWTKVRKKVTVVVTGLAPGERATVTVGAKKVTGTATAGGKLKVKVKTAKRGKAKVKAVGQFADRKGKATVRVV